jgi:hypothetical protein
MHAPLTHCSIDHEQARPVIAYYTCRGMESVNDLAYACVDTAVCTPCRCSCPGPVLSQAMDSAAGLQAPCTLAPCIPPDARQRRSDTLTQAPRASSAARSAGRPRASACHCSASSPMPAGEPGRHSCFAPVQQEWDTDSGIWTMSTPGRAVTHRLPRRSHGHLLRFIRRA